MTSSSNELRAARAVLFCTRYGIGDVLMEWPLYQAVRDLAPQAKIHVLTPSPNEELLRHHPAVDRCTTLHELGIEHWGDEGDPDVWDGVVKWLSREGPFDLCLNPLQSAPAMRTALELASIPSLESDHELLDGPDVREMTARERIRLGAVGGWGIEEANGTGESYLAIPDEARRKADEWFAERGMVRGEVIAFCPVASLHLKAWPAERFARVADSLLTEQEQALIFGGPRPERAERMIQCMKKRDTAHLTGARNLMELAAFLDRSTILVTNDTGLMHLASAVGTPVVGIFGPTAPELYLPPGRNMRAVGGDGFFCPFRRSDSLLPPYCWDGNCRLGLRSCIDFVEAEDVLLAAEDLLRAVRQPEVGSFR